MAEPSQLESRLDGLLSGTLLTLITRIQRKQCRRRPARTSCALNTVAHREGRAFVASDAPAARRTDGHSRPIAPISSKTPLTSAAARGHGM
jgi:hypothetical protein